MLINFSPVSYPTDVKWVGPKSPTKFGRDERFKYEIEEEKLSNKSPGPQSPSVKADEPRFEKLNRTFHTCIYFPLIIKLVINKSKRSSNSPKN
jgi:hypothetical protein